MTREAVIATDAGFQSFANARVVVAGIDFAQKIKKEAYDLRRIGDTDASPAEMRQRGMGRVAVKSRLWDTSVRSHSYSAICNKTETEPKKTKRTYAYDPHLDRSLHALNGTRSAPRLM